jgi:hypothetical protein
VVLGADPARIVEVHGVPAVDLPTLRGGGGGARQRAAHRVIADSAILFLGPGTVFQERSPTLRWPGTLPLFARLTLLARAAGTPVVPVGVGVREGGTLAGRALLPVLAAGWAAVATRDRRSAAHFGRRAEVIGDLAYTLEVATRSSATAGPGRRFAVSMRPLGADREGPLVTAVTGCAQRLRDEGWSGQFLPMAFGRKAAGEDDRSVHMRPGSGGRALGDVVTAADNPLAAPGPLAPGLAGWLRGLAAYDLVVGVRLHAVVLAVALGVPTVAVAYERKVHDSFVDLGLARFVVAHDIDADGMNRAARAATEDPEEFTAAAARLRAQGAVARNFFASVLARSR